VSPWIFGLGCFFIGFGVNEVRHQYRASGFYLWRKARRDRLYEREKQRRGE